MAIACTFDQWRKDVFFSAAEAIQESADIMQSTYRMWMRERALASESEALEEMYRELHTALGTAKWQLEEFKIAVKATHKNRSSEDDSVARHRQFIAAIEDQISQVEKTLKDSLMEEGKQPLRWVQLDDEECNDLAAFLSAAPPDKQREADGSSPIQEVGRPVSVKGFRESLTVDNDSKYVVELEVEEKPKNQDSDGGDLTRGQRRTWSSPDISAWKIMISDEDSKGKDLKNKFQLPSHFVNLHGLVKNTRMAAKSKRSRRNFRGDKSGALLSAKQGISSYLDLRTISRFAQGRNATSETNDNISNSCEEGLRLSHAQKTCGTIAGFKRSLQGLQYYTQFQSLRITLLLVLAVFLVVPFVFYTS